MADYRYVDPWSDELSYRADHPVRSVESDSEGRRRYATAGGFGQKPTAYLVQMETYVVHPPAFAGYRTNYDVVDNGWRVRSSPVPSSVYDRPQKVHEFLAQVQTEASRPRGLGASPPAAWNQVNSRNPPEYEEVYRGQQIDMIRPASYATYPDPQAHRPTWPKVEIRSTMETPPPSLLSSGGWARSGWVQNSYRRPGQDTNLSKPTNDIDTAVEYLKEAVKPFAGHMTRLNTQQPASPTTQSTGSERDVAPDTSGMESDNKPQYSNSKTSPNPKANSAAAAYMDTIDSREAAKRFNGVLM